MNRQLYVIRYGEIALKGNNQKDFVARFIKNIKLALADLTDISVSKEYGRVFVYCDQIDKAEVAARLDKVFGIVSYSPAEKVALDMAAISDCAVRQIKALQQKWGNFTFKVETRRANKKFGLKSPEISREVGAGVLRAVKDIKVDVKQPDVTCHVEIRGEAYVYTDVIAAQGGMPYKSAGKGLLLLSGGIDSPVAGYLMARRGLEIEAIHYHSFPFTGQRAHDKVVSLARKLAGYIGSVRLHSVNISQIQLAIREHCPAEEMTILSRRAMMIIASKIAEERRCKALITGENLGQVASQTIEGINVTTDATTLPVFRPLIAMDKLDIIRIAQKIDTYDTSILPYEDCCTVFLPKRVVTKPRTANIKKSEALYPIEKLVAKAIADMTSEVIYQAEELTL